MKKWFNEEYEFELTVKGYLRGDKTEGVCRNGEEIGDVYHSTYGSPVNEEGFGICPKLMMIVYPIMEAIRSGGSLKNIGGSDVFEKDIVCPDGCVSFHLSAKPLNNPNFYTGEIVHEN